MFSFSLSSGEDKTTALKAIFIEVEEVEMLESKIVDLFLFCFSSFI